MKFFFVIICLFFLKWGKASHVVGGEMYYDYLGNNNYRITVEVYRDCYNGLVGFDDPLEFSVFNGDNTLYGTYGVELDTLFILDYNPTDKCVIPPDNFCIELGRYVLIINLPASPTGYTIAYGRCCWSDSILNILDPGDNGLMITSFIPPNPIINSNPRFVNYPPLILCADRVLHFDYAAFDADGDSLVYRIITAYNGGSDPIPNPEPSPPFSLNNWESGFSEAFVFGSGSICSINSSTGLLTLNPSLLGSFVLAIEVAEYRDGVLLSVKERTFGFFVVTCQIIIPDIDLEIIGSLEQTESCSSAGFIVKRFSAEKELEYIVLMQGTSTNGEDYAFIDSNRVLPANVFSDTINIASIFDNIDEGEETVDIQIIIENLCDSSIKDTIRSTLSIKDYKSLTIDFQDYYLVCNEDQSFFPITISVENGLPPYSYQWKKLNHSDNFADNDTVMLFSESLKPQLNEYQVVVLDGCGYTISSTTISLNNQCPLKTPNIFTPNGDGSNDFLIITNLEDFDQVSIKVVNRWGNIVYENDAYKNDWNGTDEKGNFLTEGVYFYVLVPMDEKYIYNEKEKLHYTVQSYLHLIRN